MASKHPKIKSLSKSLIDKWARILFNVRSSFDSSGSQDVKYKKFLSNQQKQILRNCDEDQLREFELRKQNSAKIEEAAHAGNFNGEVNAIASIPKSNCFDFTERPESRAVQANVKSSNEGGVCNQIMKKMNQLIKENTRTSKSNASVKISAEGK